MSTLRLLHSAEWRTSHLVLFKMSAFHVVSLNVDPATDVPLWAQQILLDSRSIDWLTRRKEHDHRFLQTAARQRAGTIAVE